MIKINKDQISQKLNISLQHLSEFKKKKKINMEYELLQGLK